MFEGTDTNDSAGKEKVIEEMAESEEKEPILQLKQLESLRLSESP